jgi:hypothetical protein
VVHTTRGDEEDGEAAQCSKAVVAVCCVSAERSNLSFIATEGNEQAAREVKQTARR